MKGLILAAGLFLASAIVPRAWTGTALPPAGGPPVAQYAVQDMAAVLAGARRMGADVAFIQLLQYYGSGEEAKPRPGERVDDPKKLWLPRFLPLSSRIAALNPFFRFGVLFSAGTLGFVLDRPEEALSLLERATAVDPTFWRYRLYAGAIAYQKNENPDKVIVFLEEALKYPDCPSILQNILANLHKKRGDYARAAEIYRFTLQTSRDPAAVNTARTQLKRLREEGRIP